MIKSKILNTTTIAIVSAILLAWAPSAAYAGGPGQQNVINIEFPQDDVLVDRCGETGVYADRIIHIMIKDWGNKFILHLNASSEINTQADGLGDDVGDGSAVLHLRGSDINNVGMIQINVVVACADGENEINLHFGITQDANGEFHPHFPTV